MVEAEDDIRQCFKARVELFQRLGIVAIAPGIVGVDEVVARNPLDAAVLINDVGLALVFGFEIGEVAEDAHFFVGRELLAE